MANLQVCLAYLDRSDEITLPTIVPCRKATLVESHRSGSMFILEFELDEFWVADDIPLFNGQIRGIASDLPYWQRGDVIGNFCQVLTRAPSTLRATSEIADWQKLTEVMKRYKHFADEPFFYFVKSLTNIRDGNRIYISENGYLVEANASYELTIVHHGPEGGLDSEPVGQTFWLLTKNDDELISFTGTNEIAIDSPYDEKKIRFRTSNATHKTDATIALLRQTAPGVPDKSKAILDFDLSLRIQANYLSLALKGIAVGSLIAAQGAAPIYLNPNIPNKVLGYIIVGLAGVIAGLIASFGLRRL